MSPSWRGSLLVLVSAVSFGLMPIFARFAYTSGANVQELLFVRFVLAFLAMGVLLRLTGRLMFPKARQLLALLALGGIGYFLQSHLYFTALLYIPVSVVALALYTYPAFVTAASLVSGRERASAPLALSLLLALAGLVLVANPVLNAAPVGLLMALGAAATYTAYILASTRMLDDVRGEVASFFITGAAALSFGAYGSLTGQLHPAWSPQAWIWALMISLVSTSLAVTTFFQGLELIGPSRASILSVSELVTSLSAASILFGEALSITQTIGGLLILAATMLAATSRAAKKEPRRRIPRTSQQSRSYEA